MISTKKINYNITFEYTGPHSIHSTVPVGQSISFQIKLIKHIIRIPKCKKLLVKKIKFDFPKYLSTIFLQKPFGFVKK